MKKVAIIGASGMAGSAIYQLARQNKDLIVTGIVRNEERAKEILGSDAHLLVGDVIAMDASLLEPFNIIIDAFKSDLQDAALQIELAQKLVRVAEKTQSKLIFILGAASLRTGSDRHYLIEDLEKIPGAAKWINTPRQVLKELQYLETVTNVNWMGISPSAKFVPGPANNYVIGADDLLFNRNSQSVVSAGAMAEVVVKEALLDSHHQQRITVVNA